METILLIITITVLLTKKYQMEEEIETVLELKLVFMMELSIVK